MPTMFSSKRLNSFKVLVLVLLFPTLFATSVFGQFDCSTATQLCLPQTFTLNATTANAEVGPDYGCLLSTPGPSWFYLQVDQSGPIDMAVTFTSGHDVDFVVWGPFADPLTPCNGQLTATNQVDCNYGASSNPETPFIPNGQSGEFYLLMTTNFSLSIGQMTITQTSGSGTIDCTPYAPFCSFGSFSAQPVCDSTINSYDINGTVAFNSAPTSGILTLTNCYGDSIVFTAPFSSPITYAFDSIPAGGSGCYVIAQFSDSTSCIDTISFLEPIQCPITCSITNFTSNIGACNPVTNTYSLSGTINFMDPPSSGSFTITDCHGNSQTFFAPFTSSVNFNFPGIPADGTGGFCDLTASFSDDTACVQIVSYPTPLPCITSCFFTDLLVNTLPCDSISNTYGISGQVSFLNPPATGTLTITDVCSGADTVLTAPFTSPLPFSISGLSSSSSPCNVVASFSDSTCAISLISTNNLYDIPGPCNPLSDIATSTFNNTFHIFPNPASAVLNIVFELDEVQDVIVEIYDVTGKRIQQFVHYGLSPGEHQLAHSLTGLQIAPGLHLIKAIAGPKITFKKVVLN
jgi:hypothetical protein